jgi:hypothetical protein
VRDSDGRVEELARQMVTFLETGDVPDGLFRADVFCDLSMPTWRVQARGLEDVVTLRKEGHPGPGRVTCTRVDATATGFVFEFEERWRDDVGEDWYSREMIRADVVDGGIAALAVYCTGDWDRARQAEHARAVELLRQ